MKLYNYGPVWLGGFALLFLIAALNAKGIPPMAFFDSPLLYLSNLGDTFNNADGGGAMVGRACVIVAAMWGVLLHFNDFGFTYRRAKQKDLVNVFPKQVIAKPESFQVSLGRLYRKNSDGTLVKLRKWHFNVDTGEFYRIKKRSEGSILFETAPFNKRLVVWLESRTSRHVTSFFLGLFVMLTVWGLVWAHSAATPDNEWPFAVPAIPALITLLFVLNSRHLFNKAHVLGPEPLPVTSGDYGPQTAATPKSHPAADDLAYKPNS